MAYTTVYGRHGGAYERTADTLEEALQLAFADHACGTAYVVEIRDEHGNVTANHDDLLAYYEAQPP